MAAQHIFIATPSIDGMLDVHYVQALLQTRSLLEKAGITSTVSFEVGNSIISAARNNLVSQFMNSEATDLLFIDSDLSWQAESVLKILAPDHPFVGGVYQRKSEVKKDFTVKFGPDIKMENGLISVERCGTGFMRLRRDCLTQMFKAYPELLLKDRDDPDSKTLYALFDNSIVEGTYVGEDYTFCDRWRKIGGQVFVDPSLNFAHWGKKSFDEKLLDYLK